MRLNDKRQCGAPPSRRKEGPGLGLWLLGQLLANDRFAPIEDITGDSPNWRRLDKSRSWKGTDQGGHSRYFTIRDERFWEMVSRRELATRIADSMKVQWAYVQGPKGPKKHTVLRVLEFNGMRISPPMSDREIHPILDSFKSIQDEQRSFFDEE